MEQDNLVTSTLNLMEGNLYQVLDLEFGAEPKAVKKAFNLLIKTHHPDKGGDEEKFNLIRKAYEILTDENLRNKYNVLYKLGEKKTRAHEELQIHFDEEVKAKLEEQRKEYEENEEVRDKINAQFNQGWNEINEKYGLELQVNEDGKIKDEKISQEDATKKFEELSEQRNSIGVEHKNMFEGKEFNLEDFNSAFEFVSQRENEIIHQSGVPVAFNAGNTGISTYSASLDAQFSVGMNGSNNFQQLFDEKHRELSAEELQKLKQDKRFINVDVEGHNDGKESEAYKKLLEERMADYQNLSSAYQDMELDDFKKNDSQFGVLDRLVNDELNKESGNEADISSGSPAQDDETPESGSDYETGDESEEEIDESLAVVEQIYQVAEKKLNDILAQ